MLQVLWMILNVCLYCYFIYLAFNSLKLVRNEFGRWASIVFGFGLFAFTCTPNNNNTHGDDKKWTFNNPDSIMPNTKKFMWVELAHSWTNKYMLNLEYGRHKTTGEWVPIWAGSSIDGTYGAIEYTPNSITIDETKDGRFQYDVYAETKWTLLGMRILSNTKRYEGTVSLKE